MKLTRLAVSVIACLGAIGPGQAAEPMWVFLADKEDATGGRVDWDLSSVASLSPHLDLSLDPNYVQAIRATGAGLRQRSRWLNAVSVSAEPSQIQSLLALPFVVRLSRIRSLVRSPEAESPGPALRSAVAPSYGESFEQIAAVSAHLLHSRDILGQGVRIVVIDAGFNFSDHRAFADLTVIATRDFLNGDDNVGDESDEPVTGNEIENGQNLHGTRVLGVLAGNDPGRLVGIAPRAEYLLAKTENARVDERGNEVDSPTEEDRWIAALEWADSLGAQVASSSVGYTEFGDNAGYTYDDLDGATALSTLAAQMAVTRGMVVVQAAGNEGNQAWHYITVPADAAGVIAVGSVHPINSSISSFSSRGPTADGRIKPDVVAPGQQIVTVSGRSTSPAASYGLQEYQRLSGTSFSAPIVSGACALLLQLHPNWSPQDVADALRETATDLGPAGPDTLFGWGLVNVASASGIDEIIPAQSRIATPFPNPARGNSPVVHFPVALQAGEDIALSLFDAAGTLVEHIATRHLPAGDYSSAELAPSWEVPTHLANGVYLYVLQGTTFSHRGKVAILRDR